MKKIVLALLLSCIWGWAQQNKALYAKVYPYDAYRTNWAMVKNVAGMYGFIDRSGKEVVPAQYAKIYPFETKMGNKKLAMVKNVADAYGFIDQDGKEVVKAIYFKKEEAKQQLNALHHGI